MEQLRLLLERFSSALKTPTEELLKGLTVESEGGEIKLKGKEEMQSFINSTFTNYAAKVGEIKYGDTDKKLQDKFDEGVRKGTKDTYTKVETDVNDLFGIPVAKWDSMKKSLHAQRDKPVEITDELIMEKVNANPDFVKKSEAFINVTADLNGKIEALNNTVGTYKNKELLVDKRKKIFVNVEPVKKLFKIATDQQLSTYNDFVIPELMKLENDFDGDKVVKTYRINANGEKELIKNSSNLEMDYSEVVTPILSKYFEKINPAAPGGAKVEGVGNPIGGESKEFKGMSEGDFAIKFQSLSSKPEEQKAFAQKFNAANA